MFQIRDPKTRKIIVGTPLEVQQTIDYVANIMGATGNELQGLALEYDP